MTKTQLEEKLKYLQQKLKENESFMEIITQRRIDADMGDDYRENEPAKLVMERYDVWWVQRNDLIAEIAKIKKLIFSLSPLPPKSPRSP
jgi:hypothetical protein